MSGPSPTLSLGVNLPWSRYGCDFGTNAWHAAGLAGSDRARVRRALDLARRVVNGVQLGGRAWLLRDPVARHRLTTRAVDPLLAHCGHDPRILMWDLCNEPEWMAAPRWPPVARVPAHGIRRWLAELALHVRWNSPHPVTVGLASARGLPLLRDADVDVLQVHWYDQHQRRAPLERCPALPGRPRPVVLGEYPSAGSRRTVHDILEAAHRAGYAAAWGWSLLAEDSATSCDTLLAAMRTSRLI